jgi:23S rRNA pseudouridine955/2504/2580 synthase/23S rRNA pseudouridine1911/1915/1917 synthase
VKRFARTVVQAPWAGRNLLDLLAERFSYQGREKWERLVLQGAILVNGQASQPERLLQPGDAVEYVLPTLDEPPVATDYRVLYEDDAILAIDKPADLPCHPAGHFFHHTLWAFLRRDRGLTAVHFVNRLDRETSGIVLLAKDPATARKLGQPASRRSMVKEYLAVVEGRLLAPCHASGWLVPDTASRLRKKRRFVPAAAGAEPPAAAEFAETWFEPVRQASGLTLVRARLGTGRMHQIRATLLALGFPLVGDKAYGLDEGLYLRFIAKTLTDADRRLLRLDRQALHAWRLRFVHPLSAAVINLESPLPPDLAQLVPP